MNVTVRQAVSGDEAVLCSLNGMVHGLHVGARPDIFVPTSAAALTQWLGDVLADTNRRVWLAETGGVPAGYLVAVIHDRPATPFSLPRRWCEIDQLGVAPGLRRRGVARALVDAAASWARQLGITHVSAQCWSFNVEAQASFARLGFTPMLVRLERNLDAAARPTSG